MAQATSSTFENVTRTARDLADSFSSNGIEQKIEQTAAKIPPVSFATLAFGSMLVSASLVFIARRKEVANFVGLWVPSLMLMGVYDKLIRIEQQMGSTEQQSSGAISRT